MFSPNQWTVEVNGEKLDGVRFILTAHRTLRYRSMKPSFENPYGTWNTHQILVKGHDQTFCSGLLQAFFPRFSREQKINL